MIISQQKRIILSRTLFSQQYFREFKKCSFQENRLKKKHSMNRMTFLIQNNFTIASCHKRTYEWLHLRLLTLLLSFLNSKFSASFRVVLMFARCEPCSYKPSVRSVNIIGGIDLYYPLTQSCYFVLSCYWITNRSLVIIALLADNITDSVGHRNARSWLALICDNKQ